MMPSPEPVQDWARRYVEKGWQVVPLAPKSKACVEDNWIKLIFKPADFRADDNIGIRSVNGLVDVDCDCPEVAQMCRAFLPPTGACYGRPSKRYSHWLYQATLEKSIVYKDQHAEASKATLVEIRINHQSMAPPSIHPAGEVLDWEGELLDATPIDAKDLVRSVRLLATAALIGRYYNPPGQRHDWGMALSGMLKQLGLTEEEAKKVVTEAASWARDPEVKDRLDAVKSTYRRGDEDPTKGGRELKKLMPTAIGAEFVKSVQVVWGSGGSAFILDEKGDKILASNQENIRRAFKKLDVELSYDLFTDKPMVKWDRYHGPLDDKISNRIWLEIDRTYHFRPSIEYFDIVIRDSCYQNEYHPVRQYLDGLTWDGVERIDRWLIEAASAADNEYVQAVSRLVLLAAVRRIRQPGAKFDELLVLESEQGFMKSSALRALCPREEWFSDDLPLNIEAKQIIERTSGKWIIEASDLSGMSTAKVEHLKAFLSRQIDGPVRMAYARHAVERPRQFVAIGTSNSQQYLKDTTGNRRFWPVQVNRFNLKWVHEFRDQLWAEAAAKEAAGASIRLDPSLYAIAQIQQERRRAEDEWEHTLAAAFAEDKQYRLTANDIGAVLGIPVSHRDEKYTNRVLPIMQRLGFRRMTVRDKDNDNKPTKGWGREPKQAELGVGEENRGSNDKYNPG